MPKDIVVLKSRLEEIDLDDRLKWKSRSLGDSIAWFTRNGQVCYFVHGNVIFIGAIQKFQEWQEVYLHCYECNSRIAYQELRSETSSTLHMPYCPGCENGF